MLGKILFNLYLLILDIPVFIICKLGLCICGGCFRTLNTIALTCVRLAWGISLQLCCCWIRIRADGLSEMRVSLAKSSGKPRIIIQNHISFLDTIMAVTLCPVSQIGSVKMMASEHLFKMPGLGAIAYACGHLSVPFKSQTTQKNEGGGSVADFSVDRDAVKKVMERFEQHIGDGGIGAWFPEGRMNPEPWKLQMFRAGGFAVTTKYDCEIWCVVTCGNDLCWPRKAAVGGNAARIGIKCFQLCASSFEFAQHEDGAREKGIFIANQAQEKMQHALDFLMNDGWCTPERRPAASEKAPLTSPA